MSREEGGVVEATAHPLFFYKGEFPRRRISEKERDQVVFMPVRFRSGDGCGE